MQSGGFGGGLRVQAFLVEPFGYGGFYLICDCNVKNHAFEVLKTQVTARLSERESNSRKRDILYITKVGMRSYVNLVDVR